MADKYNIFTDVDLRGNSLKNVKDFNVETAEFDTIEVSKSLTSEKSTHLKNKVIITSVDSESTEDNIFQVNTNKVGINSTTSIAMETDELTETVGTKDSTVTTETHNISKSLYCTVGKSFALDAALNEETNTEVSKMGIDTLNIRDNELNFGVKNKEESILDRSNYNVHIVWNSSTKSLVFQVEED